MINYSKDPNKEGRESDILLKATVTFFKNDEDIVEKCNEQKVFSTTNSFKPITDLHIEGFYNNCERFN